MTKQKFRNKNRPIKEWRHKIQKQRIQRDQGQRKMQVHTSCI